MPRSVNKVILIGHTGKDAELRYTSGGAAVANFSLATSRRWKDKQYGEYKEETEWTNCVMWSAESVAPHITKGKPLYVEGRLQTRKWEDKEGNARYSTEVVVENLILLGDGGKRDEQPVSAPRSARRQQQPAQQESWAMADDPDGPPF
jgi:single-strand DNA-binding protein